MHRSECSCALVRGVETRTRVVVVVHHIDERKPSNTGRVAVACLANSELVLRGHPAHASSPLSFEQDTQPLVLFPSDDAVPIETFARSARRITLVVPDGSWRQASKMKTRIASLRDVPAVSFPPGPPSRYRLRAQAQVDRLSTIEAIARALVALEGRAAEPAAAALESALDDLVARIFRTRGVGD
jgi:DTW domain-containing protein YfiP